MNNENTLKLYHDFPFLFRDVAKGKMGSVMARGFECGDGWFRLIYELCQKIEKFADNVGVDKRSKDWPQARQVKEKFGGLRFSVSCPIDVTSNRFDNPFYTMVDEIIERSKHICESCGAPGTMKTEGWVSVQCPPCRESSERNRWAAPDWTYEELVKVENDQIEYLKKRLEEVKRGAR